MVCCESMRDWVCLCVFVESIEQLKILLAIASLSFYTIFMSLDLLILYLKALLRHYDFMLAIIYQSLF